MATLYYRDPGTQKWVTLAGVADPGAPVGPTGTTGPPGPGVVSGDPDNAASIHLLDGLVFVPGIDRATMDGSFVNLAGDAMIGELILPDQVAAPPSTPAVAVARGYVDQVMTVSDAEPDPVADAPVRDGLIWHVVGDSIFPPTGLMGTWVDDATNTLTWVDSLDLAVTGYDVYCNSMGPPTVASGTLLGTVAPGVQMFAHTKDAAAQAAGRLYYGVGAASLVDISVLAQTVVISPNAPVEPTTTSLTATPATAHVGDSILLVADTTADAGDVQFKKDGADLGVAVPVNATGLVGLTDAPVAEGTVVYGAVYAGTEVWAASTAPDVSVSVIPPPPVITTISLVAVTSNTSATFQVQDQYGAAMPGKVLSVRTWNPGGVSGSNGYGPSVTADENGIATLNHSEETCHTYQLYSGTVNGPWQGLPVSGGFIYSAGDGGTNTQFAVDCDDLLCFSLLAPGVYAGTLTCIGVGSVGGSYTVYGLSGLPTVPPLTQKSGAGTWNAGQQASSWLSTSATASPGPSYLHYSNSAPTLGQPVNSTNLGLVPVKGPIGGVDPPPLVVPTTYNPAAGQWLFIKAQGDNGWHVPPTGSQVGYMLSVNGRWGYMDCTWTP